MLKRPFCGMAAGLILGILIAVSKSRLLLPAAVILTVGMLLIYKKSMVFPGRWYAIFGLLSMICMLFTGYYRQKAEDNFREAYLLQLTDGMLLLAQGRLEQKEYKNEQYIYYLTSCIIGCPSSQNTIADSVPCNRIMVESKTDDYSIGEILIVNGTVKLWDSAANEGNFNASSYYRALKTDFKLKDGKVVGVYGKENKLREWLYKLRMKLKDIYASVLPQLESGVLITMMLGDKSLLDMEVKQLYQMAGISHILAISGLHISVIGMSLYRLLRKVGLGYGCVGILAGSCLLCYGSMVGMGTSVKRAVGMFLLWIIAEAVGRSYDSLNALGFLAVVLLLENPGLLFYAGFLFSFAAVLGVVWMGGAMRLHRREEDEKNKKKKSPLRETLLISLSIQLATLPLAAWYYFEIPIYSVFINLLVLPLMGAVLFLGIAGGAAGLWSVGAAKVLLFPCHLLLSMYQFLCERLTDFPFAVWITGRPSFTKMLIYYIVLFGMVCFRYVRKGRDGDVGRNTILPAGILFLCLLFVRPQRGFELDVLDVGQGDGCFLRTGEGYTVFVDGGSSDVKGVGTYRILPFLKFNAIRSIDYWMVSHTDADHISGMKEILESGYHIRYLVFSKDMVRDEALDELLCLAEEMSTEIVYIKYGDILHLGEAEFLALSPQQRTGGTDKNAKSLVLRYEEDGFSALFTGDIGEPEEKSMLKEGALNPVTFYKAAHHGSKYSNSEAFLAQLSPVVSAISCGKENRYGHPGEEAVKHIRQSESLIVYTMEDGQIKITKEKNEVIIWKYRKPLEEIRIHVLK